MAVQLMIVTVSSLMAAVAIVQAQQHQRPVPPAFSRTAHGRGVVGPPEPEPHQTVPQPFRRVSLPLYRGRGFSADGQEPRPAAAVQTFADHDHDHGNDHGNDADRTQQQSGKPFVAFRPQIQEQSVETQPQLVRKVVQRPVKRTRVADETAAVSRSPETVQRLKAERAQSADKQRARKPVSQVLRRYRDDNPDGSITWGFENDDGTYKEETIGVDCVTRGKYGYVDPDGVKREYSYRSGVRCDKSDKSDKNDKNDGDDDGTRRQTTSAVQQAQASDAYGYIDYARNRYVMANGQTVDLNGMAKNRARKPVPRRKTGADDNGGGRSF